MSANLSRLFSTYKLGRTRLTNRIVMAPMTRSRAIGNIPSPIMARYYADRADAGLLITEGTSPSPNGLGYARIPGIYNEQQVSAWRSVTSAVHENGGKIFVQLMHTGRISHPLNLPAGAEVVAPSAIAAANTPMYTDQEGMQPLPVPRALRTDEIPDLVHEFVHAAKSAIAAGFDGIELHGANGYLLEQFLNPASNARTDAYGGSPEARNRFVLEVAAAVVNAIGADRVGIRLSPFGASGEMISNKETIPQYEDLARGLSELGIAYIHLVDHSSLGAPAVPAEVQDRIRAAFDGTIIQAGGFSGVAAESALSSGKADLVAFGRPFIANPDLVKRISDDVALADPDPATFYTPGEAGYTDYPTATTRRRLPILSMFSF